jgi:hypothetical protein
MPARRAAPAVKVELLTGIAGASRPVRRILLPGE